MPFARARSNLDPEPGEDAVRRSFLKFLGVIGGAALVLPALAATADAHVLPAHTRTKAAATTVYVAPTGSSTRSDTSCRTAGFSDINTAIAAVTNGSTVVVCRGKYMTDALVDKPITLQGTGPGTLIDATGQPEVIPGAGGNGVTVLAAKATVETLSVVNASGDGILVAGVDKVSVIATKTAHNGGFGIDLNSTSGSKASANTASDNFAGGINVANDLGVPASHNTINGNRLVHNSNGCGIVLADHTGAGIFDNSVTANVSDGNGLIADGAGIILASPVPGGAVYDNTLTNNEASGNGIAGIAVHGHLSGQNFSGNVFKGNFLGRNNLDGDDPGIATGDVPDPQTTGILVATSDPTTITIKNNVIHDDFYGIWTNGGITIVGSNTFANVVVPVFDATMP